MTRQTGCGGEAVGCEGRAGTRGLCEKSPLMGVGIYGQSTPTRGLAGTYSNAMQYELFSPGNSYTAARWNESPLVPAGQPVAHYLPNITRGDFHKVPAYAAGALRRGRCERSVGDES